MTRFYYNMAPDKKIVEEPILTFENCRIVFLRLELICKERKIHSEDEKLFLAIKCADREITAWVVETTKETKLTLRKFKERIIKESERRSLIFMLRNKQKENESAFDWLSKVLPTIRKTKWDMEVKKEMLIELTANENMKSLMVKHIKKWKEIDWFDSENILQTIKSDEAEYAYYKWKNEKRIQLAKLKEVINAKKDEINIINKKKDEIKIINAKKDEIKIINKKKDEIKIINDDEDKNKTINTKKEDCKKYNQRNVVEISETKILNQLSKANVENRFKAIVELENELTEVILDEGADINIISTNIVDEKGLKVRKTNNTKIKNIFGPITEINSKTEALVKMNGRSALIEFLVAETENKNTILLEKKQ